MSAEAFQERLSPPWWLWLATPAATVTALTELALGVPALAVPLGYAVAVALGLLIPLSLVRLRIAVTADELRVDDARLPGWAIGGVSVLDLAARRRLLGLDSHPLAFIVQRPWIPGGVRIDLADPQDPTPYWYVSSRRPQALADAVQALAARSAPATEPVGTENGQLPGS